MTTYIFIANIAVWLGIGGYTAFLSLKQKKLTTRIKQLEQIHND